MHLSIWQEMGHPNSTYFRDKKNYWQKKQGLRKNTLPVNVTPSSEVLKSMLDEIVQCQMLQNLPIFFLQKTEKLFGFSFTKNITN